MTAVDRRMVLTLLGAGIAHAQLEAALVSVRRWQQGEAADPSATYFTRDEFGLLDVLTDLIIPDTPRSPGARAARASAYIDLVVAHSPVATQQAWRTQLAALDGEARQRESGAFVRIDDAARRRVLDALSARERQPDTDAVRAFVRVKQATIDAYYSSEIGLRQELGYLGPQMLDRFPGCER